MSKSSKGASFERETCRALSTWFSSGVSDDWFWRSAGSGGMATTRAKKGKATYGQNGDIQATHPEGAPLTRLFSIELKRGYSKVDHFGDIFDKPDKLVAGKFEEFIDQAIRSHKNEGTRWWMLIQRRDRRDALVFLPEAAARSLEALGIQIHANRPSAYCKLRLKKPNGGARKVSVFVMRFDHFLTEVPAASVKALENLT